MSPEQVRQRYADLFEPRRELGPDYTESGRVERRYLPREFRKLEEQYRRAWEQ